MTDARALRTALTALHKELLEAQRIQAEHIRCPLPPGPAAAVVLEHRDVIAVLDQA